MSRSSAGPSRLSPPGLFAPTHTPNGPSYPVHGTRPRKGSSLSLSAGISSEATLALPPLPQIPCERGECPVSDPKTFWCVYCDGSFCDNCWAQERPHKQGKLAPDGHPHEKADLAVVNRLKETFTPSADPQVQRQLHEDDEETAWFGIERDVKGDPTFQDYGRFATLLANSATDAHITRYPQLVSFIGQTGAGKSTIVKMLIEQMAGECGDADSTAFPRPVVGSARNDNTPTSGDVHLYADPATYNKAFPLLYADCEGLEGSEVVPIGRRHREADAVILSPSKKRVDGHDDKRRNKIIKKAKIARGRQRDIAWATSPEKKKRQYAVEELYPRLLYTFSDVIVFVLNNAKTFEATVLNKLLSWAHASMERSVNQPTLPHAIIALNASDMNVDGGEWDPNIATDCLMSSVAGALQRDAQYQEYATYFRERGKVVNTMQDLLLCYYSSIRVVRIPKKEGRYMVIDQQVAKLREEIAGGCKTSYFTKRKARMLSNSTELNVYLQYAFDHFSQNIDKPFNFINVAFKNNPIPQDFGGSILKLAASIPGPDGRHIFRDLSNMVASCIMLDCARQGLRGSLEDLLTQYYMNHCDNALIDFCQLFWKCEYSNTKGRCVNVKNLHKKGHQNAAGRIIDSGSYVSTFNWDSFKEEWLVLLVSAVNRLQEALHSALNCHSIRNEPAVEKPYASHIHKTEVQQFYARVGGASNYSSHAACFCCLREPAEHPLPCGHVICTQCVIAYGRYERGPSVHMDRCPLHEHERTFSPPWIVRFKPVLAGIRILTLDGGGVRGIIELEALSAIQDAMGVDIPIDHFFDMIAGTSTGGIIALGLGIQHWTVKDCMDKFTRLSQKAFTGRLANIKMPSKYKTKDFVEALDDVFPREKLFGGRHRHASSYHTKVVITSATETGDHAVALTNYNRQPVEQPSYSLVRPDDPSNELTLTEAARATSAAPGYFKPFVNPRTNEGYLDGALFHNNPVRIAYCESKLVWPDIADLQPDILLSLGTGHHGQATMGLAETLATRRARAVTSYRGSVNSALDPAPKSRGRFTSLMKKTWIGQFFTLALNRIDNILNAEQIWQDFRNEVLIDGGQVDGRSHFERLNPNLGIQPPKLDAKDKIGEIADAACRNMRDSPKYRQRISRIVNRLIASSFYFHQDKDAEPVEDGGYKLLGKIRCRFPNGSDELRELGKFFQKQQTASFQPYFRIFEARRDDLRLEKKFLTKNKIDAMITSSNFDMGMIEIRISGDLAITCVVLEMRDREINKHDCISISGFPRAIIAATRPKVPTHEPTADRPAIRTRRSARRTHLSSNSLDTMLNNPPTGNHARSNSATSSASDNSREAAFDHDWLSRRARAARRPPSAFQMPFEPMSPEFGSAPVFLSPAASPRQTPSPLYAAGHHPGSNAVDPDDDDEMQMTIAIERSLRDQANAESASTNSRFTMGGTDRDELETALRISRMQM